MGLAAEKGDKRQRQLKLKSILAVWRKVEGFYLSRFCQARKFEVNWRHNIPEDTTWSGLGATKSDSNKSERKGLQNEQAF